MVRLEYSQVVRRKLKNLRNELTQNYGKDNSKKIMSADEFEGELISSKEGIPSFLYSNFAHRLNLCILKIVPVKK